MESQQDFIHIIVHTTSHGNPSTENNFFSFFLKLRLHYFQPLFLLILLVPPYYLYLFLFPRSQIYNPGVPRYHHLDHGGSSSGSDTFWTEVFRHWLNQGQREEHDPLQTAYI